MLKLEVVAPRVWAIFGEGEEDAARAFIRFQEYYENPELKNKKDITVTDVENWWKRARDKGLKDVYYNAWAGFNIPGRIILECVRSPLFRPKASIRDVFSSRWNAQEDELLALIETLPHEEVQNGYFVAMWKDSNDVLEHEIAHAFFSTCTPYKAEQTMNIAGLPKDIYDHMITRLKEMGYHGDVVLDEMQAYLSTYVESIDEHFNADCKDYARPFAETFQRYRKLLSPTDAESPLVIKTSADDMEHTPS